MRNYRQSLVWILGSILSLLVAGCQQPYPIEPQKIAPPPPSPMVSLTPSEGIPTPSSKKRIALLLPLSGDKQEIGAHLLNAAQMAFLKNPSDNLILLPFDTQGTEEGARQALIQAQNAQVTLLVGPLTAAETRAVKSSASTLPILSFSNDKSIAGDGTFILGVLPDDQVNRVIEHLKAHNHAQLLVVAPQTPFGQQVQQAAKAALEAHHLLLPHTAFYQTQMPIDETFIDRLPLKTADAILLPESGATLQTIAGHLAIRDSMSPQKACYGLDNWRTSTQLHRDSNLRGCYFAGLSLERFERFQESYREIYGKPPHLLAGLAYDAINMVKILEKHNFAPEAFISPHGFLGVYGPFRLTPAGLNERRLALYVIQDNSFQTAEPSAADFSDTLASP